MRILAMDIGASSGKLTAATWEDGRLETEVVHRFDNVQITVDGHLCWDIDRLYDEMVKGLDKAGKADYVTIDTWAVDFVLLDRDGKRITPAVAYRDRRTDNVHCPIPQSELYSRTGIQYQKFNTIYQLLALKQENPEVFGKAEDLLFIPDYLAYRLTGVKVQEYTNATTSNLVKAGTREWDRELINELVLPQRLFKDISMSGRILGPVKAECGGSFILAPTHDTACAVLASPLGERSLFLSSGTWSLLGCVNPGAITSEKAMKANITNEGADDGQIRLLKNIMGTWMLQSIRNEMGKVDFQWLCEEAQKSRLVGTVDALCDRFLSPSSMSGEICKALEEEGKERPQSPGELANVVYHSLALAYRKAVQEMEEITGRTFDHLAIVGGGAKDDYLNSLAKKYTGLRVTAGPFEGSAAGAVISALIHTGEIERKDIGQILKESFSIKETGE